MSFKTPNIFKRGVLLIVTPALIASFALVVLSRVIAETDRLSAVEQRQSEVALEFGRWFGAFAAYGYDLIHSSFEAGKQPQPTARASQTQSREIIARIKSEFEGEALATINYLERRQNEVQALADKIFSSVRTEDFHNDIARFRAYASLMNKLKLLPDYVEVVQAQQLAKLDKTREKSKAIRNTIKPVLFGGYLTSVILGSWLIYVFATDLGKRLSILRRRTTKLSSTESPGEPLGGNDELNYLDSALIEASQEISAACENRKSIKRVIAHDMRSPLTAAHIHSVVLQEDYSDRLSAGGLKLAGQLEKCLQQVISTINKLLTTDTLEERKEEEEKEEREVSDINQQGQEDDAPADAKGKAAKSKQPSGLFRTCLVIGITPILLQTVSIACLLSQINKSERCETLERLELSRVQSFARLLMCSFKIHYATAFYVTTHKREYADLTRTNLANCESEYKALYDGADSEERKSLIAAANPLTQKETTFFTDAVSETNQDASEAPSGKANQIMSQLPYFAERAVATNIKLLGLMNDEMRRLDSLRTDEEAAHKLTGIFIYISIAADLIIAALLFGLFSANIARKVVTLTAEARQLTAEAVNADQPRQTKLPEKSEDETHKKETQDNEQSNLDIEQLAAGKDELSAIARALLKVSRELQESRQERQEFMKTIVERIRSPLNEAQNILKQFSPDESAALGEQGLKHVGAALKSIARIQTLIDDLLLIETQVSARQQTLSLRKTHCSLQSVAQEAIDATQSLAANKKIALVNCLGHGQEPGNIQEYSETEQDETNAKDMQIYADRARIVEAIVNYIDNAIKFSPDGSRIEVSATKTANGTDICVRDQGPGIAADLLSKIFEQNFQVKDQSKQYKRGFGIGLYSCKLIAEAHGGTAFAESTQGQGSAFHLLLPQ